MLHKGTQREVFPLAILISYQLALNLIARPKVEWMFKEIKDTHLS